MGPPCMCMCAWEGGPMEPAPGRPMEWVPDAWWVGAGCALEMHGSKDQWRPLHLLHWRAGATDASETLPCRDTYQRRLEPGMVNALPVYPTLFVAAY